MDHYKVSQHIGWMRMYLHGMTENNPSDLLKVTVSPCALVECR
jgi:hypothetical protein